MKLTRKPPKPHRPAVQAIPPTLIELIRARLLEEDRLRDATLLVVLAYAGLRPQEALALEWRHVRQRTLLVERALSDGKLKEEFGVDGARPYLLRHASLLIHEGRLSVVDLAAQLGHNPTVCLDTYAHVMAEQRGAAAVSAEEQILQARHAAQPGLELTLASDARSGPGLLPARPRSGAGPHRIAISRQRSGDYGVDLTYEGAGRDDDARAAEQLLRAAGLTSSAHQEVGNTWTVRFGPLPRERARARALRVVAKSSHPFSSVVTL